MYPVILVSLVTSPSTWILSRASVAFHVAAETPAGVLRETANILPEIA